MDPMIFKQIAVFIIYVGWFAGPFFCIEYAKDRKISRETYGKIVANGAIIFSVVAIGLSFIVGDIVIPIWIVSLMNLVAYMSAQRLNALGIPKTRALWILTGIGVVGVPLYCLSVADRKEDGVN